LKFKELYPFSPGAKDLVGSEFFRFSAQKFFRNIKNFLRFFFFIEILHQTERNDFCGLKEFFQIIFQKKIHSHEIYENGFL